MKYLNLHLLSKKVIVGLISLSMLLAVSLIVTHPNISIANNDSLAHIEDTSGGILNKGAMLDPIDMKDEIIEANSVHKIFATNHMPQTPAYDYQDYSQEMVQVHIACAAHPASLQINGVDVAYGVGGVDEVIPMRVPNSGELTISTTDAVCASAHITNTYQNPQKLNSQNKPVVASGGTLIVDPLSIETPFASEGINQFSVLGRGDIFTPAKFSYQSIRGAYVSITSPIDQSIQFYKPQTDGKGVEQLDHSKSVLTLDLKANSSKTALVPVDFYGQINYSGTVSIQLLGIVKDSLPVFNELNAPTTEPTVFRDTANFEAEFDQVQDDEQTDDYKITFDLPNNGNPVDLASSPYYNFTGSLSFPSSAKPTSLVLYKNDLSTPMGSAFLDLTKSDLMANYNWNFYSMLGDTDANIIVVATFQDGKEITSNAHIRVIVPDETTTVIQPSTRIGDDIVDRLLSYDDKHIYLSGTSDVRTNLYDSAGTVLDEHALLHVGDILVLRTPDTADKQGEELLRNVTAIWIEGGKTVIETTKASLPDAVVQAQEDRCNVVPVNDTTPLSFDAIPDKNNDYDTYAPATSAEVDNPDEYNALRDKYTNMSAVGEAEDPQLMDCEADTDAYADVNTQKSPQSASLLPQSASGAVPANKPQFTLNIPFQHSWRATGAKCGSPVSQPGVKSNLEVCIQGRGQIDIGVNIKLMFGFHFEMDVKVNWKYVAASIAIGVAVFLAIEFASIGLGVAGALIAGIAAAVGSCILLGCVEFNKFSASAIFGWQIVAGVSLSGKLTVKIQYTVATIPLEKSVIFLGFLPIEQSVNFVPKLALEFYASYGFGWRWSAGQTKEIGKKYVRGEGWSDINITQKDQGTPASDQPSELFTFGVAFIPIAELNFKLYESLTVYMQARFKFELINIASCLPLTKARCGGASSPYLAFRFTISLRIGVKFEVDAGNFKFKGFDLSDDFMIFNVEKPLLCWWPDENNSCNGMHAYPIPSVEQFASDTTIQIEQILNAATGPDFDNYLQMNAITMTKDQVLMGIAAYMKYHNNTMTNYIRNIISNFDSDTIMKLLAKDDYEACGANCKYPNYPNYLPYSLITAQNKAKKITFRNQTGGCNTAGNRAQYGYVVYDKDGNELQKVPSNYNLSKKLGDRGEMSVDGCVNHERTHNLPEGAYKIKGNFNVGVASSWHRTDFCDVSDKPYACENGYMRLTTNAKYVMGDNMTSHDSINVEGTKIDDRALLTRESAVNILRAWVEDTRHNTEYDEDARAQVSMSQELTKKLQGYLNRTDSGNLSDLYFFLGSAQSSSFKNSFGLYPSLGYDTKISIEGYTYDYHKLSNLLQPETFIRLFGELYTPTDQNSNAEEISGMNYRLGEFITELYSNDANSSVVSEYLENLSLTLCDDDYIAFLSSLRTRDGLESINEEEGILKSKLMQLVCGGSDEACDNLTVDQLNEHVAKVANNRIYNYAVQQISGNGFFEFLQKTYGKTDICGNSFQDFTSADYKCKQAIFPLINLWLYTNTLYEDARKSSNTLSIGIEGIIALSNDEKDKYINNIANSGADLSLSGSSLARFINAQILIEQSAFFLVGDTTINAASGEFLVPSPSGGNGAGKLHFFATSSSKYDQMAWDERVEYCPEGTTPQGSRCIAGNHDYPKSIKDVHHDAIIAPQAQIDEFSGKMTNISDGQTIKVTITKDGDTNYAPSATTVTYTVISMDANYICLSSDDTLHIGSIKCTKPDGSVYDAYKVKAEPFSINEAREAYDELGCSVNNGLGDGQYLGYEVSNNIWQDPGNMVCMSDAFTSTLSSGAIYHKQVANPTTKHYDARISSDLQEKISLGQVIAYTNKNLDDAQSCNFGKGLFHKINVKNGDFCVYEGYRPPNSRTFEFVRRPLDSVIQYFEITP